MSRLVLVLALSAPAAAVAAEVPKVELFGGYSHARHEKVETDGFEAEMDVSLGSSFGVELSVAGHYKSEQGTSRSWTTLFGGPRYAWRGKKLTPFLHLLGGAVRSSQGVDVFEVSIREKDTDLAGALGGGLDIGLGRSWAIRVQADWVLQDAEEGLENDARASAGVVYRIGSR
jgi:hypothetical protein